MLFNGVQESTQRLKQKLKKKKKQTRTAKNQSNKWLSRRERHRTRDRQFCEDAQDFIWCKTD